jgi:thiol-disulfide isomerase/thioredoxin
MTDANQDYPQAPAPPGPDQRRNSRRRWLYGVAAGAATVAGLALAAWQRSRKLATDPGKPALWQLSFDTPSQSSLPMERFAGKPLLLNFWATWCPPCVDELPLLDRFFTENSTNGWQVLGLAVDQADAVSRFLARAPVRFPVAMAGMEGIELSKALGNLGGGLPFTVVLGADGQVMHRKMGRVTEQDLQAWRTLAA